MCFLLGPGLFSGAMSVSFREGVVFGASKLLEFRWKLHRIFKVETCKSTRILPDERFVFWSSFTTLAIPSGLGKGRFGGLEIFFGGGRGVVHVDLVTIK